MDGNPTRKHSWLVPDACAFTPLCQGPEPEAGGLYDISLSPDYNSKLFDLKQAMLAQQDILGVDGKLIGPWDTATALRPGTLVAIEANLIVYSFCKKTDPGTVCPSAASSKLLTNIRLGFSDSGSKGSDLGELPHPGCESSHPPPFRFSPKEESAFEALLAPFRTRSDCRKFQRGNFQATTPSHPDPIAEGSNAGASRPISDRAAKRHAGTKN